MTHKYEGASGHYLLGVGAAGAEVDCGLVEGPRVLTRSLLADDQRSDLTGAAVIDAVQRGEDYLLSMTIKEWTVATRSLLFARGEGHNGPAGKMASDYTVRLKLTAVANTEAARNGPLTIECHHCDLISGGDTVIPIGSVARDVPLVFRLYPEYDRVTGIAEHFTATYPQQ